MRIWIPLMLMALASPLPLASPGAHGEENCRPADLLELERACLRSDGLYDLLDEQGRVAGTTHGADHGAAEGPTTGAQAAARDPCGGWMPGDYYVQPIYAYPLDRPDLFEFQKEDLLGTVHGANGIFHDAAVETGGVEADLRVRCEGGEVHFARAQIPKLAVQSHFQAIVDDLRAQGFDDPKVKYWVYWDAWRCLGCRGMANIEPDDRASVSNRNNGNTAIPLYAVMYWEFTPQLWLHELSHALGAVQHSAPHSTWGWHCTDGLDVLCYADGTGPYDPTVCAQEQYDCNHDDYFHAAPPAESYLATHWNLGAAYNRYGRFT